MRASPFNKKSGSILGRIEKEHEDAEEYISMGSSSKESLGEMSEVVMAPKARRQRGNRVKVRYILSDSQSENNELSDDSDFNEGKDEK